MFKLSKNKNLLFYGTSLIGSSHVKLGSVCQDANKVIRLSNGWIVAAVADGVGSAKHSDIASKMAVDTVAEICNIRIDKQSKLSELRNVILEAYREAERRIEDYADKKGDSITEYDTTLSMVVYDGENISYGHSGDGGIIGLSTDGEYIKITNPQKAEDNICVIPLRAGEKAWVIGYCEKRLASILLATDGILDTFFPYLLKGQAVELYVPLVRFFMDNNCMHVNDKNLAEIEKRRIDFLKSSEYNSVTDDKTLLVVLKQNIVPALKEESDYDEPDWEKLQYEWNKKAYPQLYKDVLAGMDGQPEKVVLDETIINTGEKDVLDQ